MALSGIQPIPFMKSPLPNKYLIYYFNIRIYIEGGVIGRIQLQNGS